MNRQEAITFIATMIKEQRNRLTPASGYAVFFVDENGEIHVYDAVGARLAECMNLVFDKHKTWKLAHIDPCGKETARMLASSYRTVREFREKYFKLNPPAKPVVQA